MYGSPEICVRDLSRSLKFTCCLGSATAEVFIKLQSAVIIRDFARSYDKTRYIISKRAPSVMMRIGTLKGYLASHTFAAKVDLMMTSSSGDIFRVTGRNKGQWRRALIFSLICVWINCWVCNGEAGDLRRHLDHYDVSVMYSHIVKSCKEQTTSKT